MSAWKQSLILNSLKKVAIFIENRSELTTRVIFSIFLHSDANDYNLISLLSHQENSV